MACPLFFFRLFFLDTKPELCDCRYPRLLVVISATVLHPSRGVVESSTFSRENNRRRLGGGGPRTAREVLERYRGQEGDNTKHHQKEHTSVHHGTPRHLSAQYDDGVEKCPPVVEPPTYEELAARVFLAAALNGTIYTEADVETAVTMAVMDMIGFSDYDAITPASDITLDRVYDYGAAT
jgi:hypothetical protein